MRIRFLAAAGLVLIGMSATACSGGSSQADSAASSSFDVCSLMTAKRASSITGVTYSKAASSKDQCTYTTTDAPFGMFIIISPNSGGTAAWKDEVSTLEEDGSDQPLVTIHGFSGPAAGDAIEMGVQVGSDIIDVHGGDPNGTGSAFPESIAIAKQGLFSLRERRSTPRQLSRPSTAYGSLTSEGLPLCRWLPTKHQRRVIHPTYDLAG